MRIGVDATCWTNRRGYGRFARALLTAAIARDPAREYVFFTDDESAEFPYPRSSVEVVRVRSSKPTVKAAAADGSRSLGDMWAMSRALGAAKVDVLFFPSVYSFVPVFNSVPKLVTIHDVIPERFPEYVFPSWRSKLFWNAKVKMGIAQAKLVLTVSEYSRKCLAETLHISESRLRVVNEAGDPAFRRLDSVDPSPLYARLSVPANARTLVYVGGFSPHKNLPMLVDVFSTLQREQRFADVHLLLVGDYQGDVFYSGYKPLLAQVERLGLKEFVHFTGYMGDADLLMLLNATECLALPSFIEGFGLPAVEAAQCGAPVVVTSESPLGELLGDGAIAIAPNDRGAWAAALAAVLSEASRREKMRAAGLAATAKLSWNAAAGQLLEIFDEVTAQRAATH